MGGDPGIRKPSTTTDADHARLSYRIDLLQQQIRTLRAELQQLALQIQKEQQNGYH